MNPTNPAEPSKLSMLLAAARAELVLGAPRGVAFPQEATTEELRCKAELAIYFERCQLEDEMAGDGEE